MQFHRPTRRLFAVVAVVVFLFAAITVTNASKTNVVTKPVGFVKLSAQGNTAAPWYNYFGLSFTRIPTNRGRATPVAFKKLAVDNTLIAGQFNFTADGHPAYFIELTSGPSTGLLDDIVSNDTTRVSTATDLTSRMGGSQTYRICSHWTLGKVFGATNSVGLKGGGAASEADNIQVWDPTRQGYVTYYYKTGGLGGSGWRATTESFVEMSNAVLRVNQGVLLMRQSTNNMPEVPVAGAVKLGTTISRVVSNGFTFAGNVYAANLALGQSGLYTTNAITGLKGGNSAADADTVQIWEPLTQVFATYYYNTNAPGGGGWRSASGSSDASSNVIPVGAMTIIQRKHPNAFDWRMPQPFATN
jgi:uncharacterized protein (TIGR02597 family)